MESTHCFGALKHLVGVYCESNLQTTEPTAVIMLTAGMLHHVGPQGLHVQIARQLAGAGVASFRFDLSGIGESLAIGSQGTSLERAQHEVSAAMDWLCETHGFKRFLLFGLCSGADDALATAVQDDRVVGISLMDGCGYRTRKFYWKRFLRKYLPKLLSLKKWQLNISNYMSRGQLANSMPIGFDIREFPEHQVTARQLVALQQRGLQMQFIYTGGVIDYYSYATQFFDMFPALMGCRQIAVEYMPEADHLVMLQSDRAILLDKLIPWLTKAAQSGAEPRGVPVQTARELVSCG